MYQTPEQENKENAKEAPKAETSENKEDQNGVKAEATAA